MVNDIEPPHIKTNKSFRDIITADFESMSEPPIQGGCGYTLEDAIIIDINDPIVTKGMPFECVRLEYMLVEKRTYEELIIFRQDNDRYSGMSWHLLDQRLLRHNGRNYDKHIWEVMALPDKDWFELKEEWEGPNGFGTPEFDVDAHNRKRDSKSIRYITEYWFDITSLYGDRQYMSTWEINLERQTATSINGITLKLTKTNGKYEGVCLNPKDIPPDDLDNGILSGMVKEASLLYRMELERRNG